MIIISGHSDDLIEFNGNISEEYDVINEKAHIIIPNSLECDFIYTDEGLWKFQNIKLLDENLEYSLIECNINEMPHTSSMAIKYDVVNYSDALVIYKDIKEFYIDKYYFYKKN